MKIVTLSVAALLLCGTMLVAQESEPLIQFSGRGKAIWAPLVYRGHGDSDTVNSRSEGAAGMGVGAGPEIGNENVVGATLGIDVIGKAPSENIGFNLSLKVQPGREGVPNSTPMIYARDNTAYIWVKPFGDVLDMRLGMYQWDELRGKIGGIGEVVGGYGGNEDDIFQRTESDTFGSLLILRPPSPAPDAVKGLMLFSSFGVSGGLDSLKDTFAAKSADAINYIFTTPQAGIAYKHDAFGLVRFQFIGGTYMWGEGNDWNNRTTQYPWYGTTLQTHWWFPPRAREATQLEMAVNLDFIPNLNLDIGCSYPLAVTVRKNDDGSPVAIGPNEYDLNLRNSSSVSAANRRLADQEGDVWQPPVRLGLGLDYKAGGFGIRVRGKMEFGEEVTFSNGSPDYKSGLLFETGIEPSYTFDEIGKVSLNAALRVKRNGSYGGKNNLNDKENTVAVNSITHNGRMDLGLGAFFTKPFGSWGYIKTGFCATLPLGGDRYEWSTDDIPDDLDGHYFKSKYTEAYKQLNLVFAVPIIVEVFF